MIRGSICKNNLKYTNPILDPTFRRSFPSNFGTACRRHFCRLGLAAPAAEFRRRRFDRINIVGFLAGRDPHDADGVADHVGGALLTLGTP
jgi:hypothetical protein